MKILLSVNNRLLRLCFAGPLRLEADRQMSCISYIWSKVMKEIKNRFDQKQQGQGYCYQSDLGFEQSL